MQPLELCHRRRRLKARVGEQHASVEVRVRPQRGGDVAVVELVDGRLHDQRARHAGVSSQVGKRLVRGGRLQLLGRHCLPGIGRLAI